MAGPKTVDEYIAGFDGSVKKTLKALRNFIKAEIPGGEEKISYGMPTFYLNGNIIHFAAFRDHYGIFPGPDCIEKFAKKLSPYRTGKGTLCFPFGTDIPWTLLKQLLRFRVKENLAKAKARKKPLHE